MRELMELQNLIEKARLELDQSLAAEDSYETYYEKSLYLDRLIEEYLDAKECESSKSEK